MANNLSIQNTINWSAAFLDQQPVKINGMEPALSAAQLVLQTILGAPFAWAFNRNSISYTANTQDYVYSGLNDFGFLEGGTVTQPGENPFGIGVRNILDNEGNAARPLYASAIIDDGAGNITFRLNPVAKANSLVKLLYQRKAPLVQSLAQTWYPLPDEKNFICQWGFLSLMSLIGNDDRFNKYNQKFITSLLSAHGGLNAMERNIFLTNWTAVLKDLQAAQLSTAERFKAREV